jgi:hypothetical protein
MGYICCLGGFIEPSKNLGGKYEPSEKFRGQKQTLLFQKITVSGMWIHICSRSIKFCIDIENFELHKNEKSMALNK